MCIREGKKGQAYSMQLLKSLKTQDACLTTYPRLINMVNCITFLGGGMIVIRKWPAFPVTTDQFTQLEKFPQESEMNNVS